MFFTNYDSAKAAQLAANPRACLVFFWAELERQVRVNGVVTRVPAGGSDAYFASRPLDSQLGAWASPQSRVIPDREELDAGGRGRRTLRRRRHPASAALGRLRRGAGRRSSSGRAAPTACTTGCATAATARLARERLAP